MKHTESTFLDFSLAKPPMISAAIAFGGAAGARSAAGGGALDFGGAEPAPTT